MLLRKESDYTTLTERAVAVKKKNSGDKKDVNKKSRNKRSRHRKTVVSKLSIELKSTVIRLRSVGKSLLTKVNKTTVPVKDIVQAILLEIANNDRYTLRRRENIRRNPQGRTKCNI